MQIHVCDLRAALDALWSDAGALSRNPLVEQLELVDAGERDVYKRAMALIDAILQAAQQVKGEPSPDGAFELLNAAYGMEGEMLQRYKLTTAQPDLEKLACTLNLSPEAVESKLEHAIKLLATQLGDA